ncbi:MAG TPA: aminodeoxychorismate/anthranilate synthase component II [Lacipirellulaceae bacterium]|nr:aminodeoxychorismate/anthranilate synthase component II [Lacipirellulaceae bacterium]
MILLIDNYDSFVHNLARYLRRLGQETLVVRNDALGIADIKRLAPRAIVLSPGPCTPAEAGCCGAVVEQLGASVPILGVCLGHQAIAAALGASVIRAAEPRHGRTSSVRHEGSPLFAGIPSPFMACRYHSLTVDEASLPAAVQVTARADDGCVMALEHRKRPLFGVQFHPEAVLTEHGYRLLANFLEIAGLSVAADAEQCFAGEVQAPRRRLPVLSGPVTF